MIRKSLLFFAGALATPALLFFIFPSPGVRNTEPAVGPKWDLAALVQRFEAWKELLEKGFTSSGSRIRVVGGSIIPTLPNSVGSNQTSPGGTLLNKFVMNNTDASSFSLENVSKKADDSPALTPEAFPESQIKGNKWVVWEYVNKGNETQGVEIDGDPSTNTITLKTIDTIDSFTSAPTAIGATPIGQYQNLDTNKCDPKSGQCSTVWEIKVEITNFDPKKLITATRFCVDKQKGQCHVNIPSQ